MAVEVVTGAPFSGKARYVRDEIARREAAGELGLVAVDWTALYAAMVWGAQSALRDDPVSDTGAPRFAGYVFEVAAAAVAARELSGYILTQSPERAITLADRFDARLLETPVDPGDVADRAEAHMVRLGRTVARAAAGRLRPQCRAAAVRYFREEPRLVGRAHVVRRRGRGHSVDPQPKRPFDRALWERGLTDRGRAAFNALKAAGDSEPSPADVMRYLLRDRT